MRFCFGLFFSSAVVLLTAGLALGSEVEPANLRCDGRITPLAVDDPAPLLSWCVAAEARGAAQHDYRILAASDTALLAEGKADLWDSGRVASSAQRARYAGRPLASGQRLFWSVGLWDGAGQASAWSPPAEWTMGLLAPEEWQARWVAGPESPPIFDGAQWIWTADGAEGNAPPGVRAFRRTFEALGDVASATVAITADNAFKLFVNGREIGTGNRWEEAYTFDVAKSLHKGTNVIAVEASNGAEQANPAGLIAKLSIRSSDGVETVVTTDRNWRCMDNAPIGWHTPGFDDAQWWEANALGPYGIEPWGRKAVARERALPMLRKAFTPARKPIKHAVAYVCGLGHFELSVNGQKAGEHFLDPGWTNYRKTCLYVASDVTGQLCEGENVLGVMLGNGMYNVVGGRYTKFTGSFGPPKFILHLRIDYGDGTSERIVSDASWKAAPSPVTFSCMYGGEDYDARLEQPGWDRPGFDDTAWTPARVVQGPGGVLRAQVAPPLKVVRTLSPATTQHTGPGEYAFDMGENLSARPVVTVKGSAGDTIILRVGELPGKPWENHSYTYTLRGSGRETFRPLFTYFGFQYIFVSGADLPDDAEPGSTRPILLSVKSEFVTSASPAVGSFSASNALLNDINDMVDRSVRSNLQSVLTDCPHREKLGWLEVSHLMGPSILYHYDAHGLYRKICRDTTEAQWDNGMVPDIAPEYTRFHGGFLESAEWGSACVQNPWLLYRWYGDTDILERQYDTMAKYTRYLATTRNAHGLAKAGLGDWYDWTPEHGHAGASQLTPGELPATAMLFDNASILGRVARLLKREDDARAFDALAEEVRADFIAAYYDSARQSVATGSQAALAVGLYFGLVPEDARDAVCATLIENLEEAQFKPSTGEVCFRYLLQALARAGRSDVVYRIIARTDCPGYGWMLREYGLRTLSERWDRPGSSLNHCMFGHVQEWFQGDLLGIRQADDSVGFQRPRIAPTPVEGITQAKGHFDSPRGRIAVAWEKTGKIFELRIEIPGNTIAEVVLPVAPATPVIESGKPLDQVPGIANIQPIDGKRALAVGAGRYHFQCHIGN
ncbi:MAG: family 78 glycoside hydrolase catalytic domain [Candidatus Hydrogenedentes bacterium]|nr:family 78 glycoside hydrolase catalytic domain [Candidatus Hydrogenedentota bacterium]